MYAKKSANVKVIATLLAIALLIGGAVGGTVAYLTMNTDPVVNTFVAGDIGNLTLTETAGTLEDNGERSFMIIPGKDVTKNPQVFFEDCNVDAYVFVKVDAVKWTSDEATRMNYTADGTAGKVAFTIDPSWTLVPGATNVYYQEATADVDFTDWVINSNNITVSDQLVDDEMPADASLTFTAYAIQKEGFADAAEAWDELS